MIINRKDFNFCLKLFWYEYLPHSLNPVNPGAHAQKGLPVLYTIWHN